MDGPGSGARMIYNQRYAKLYPSLYLSPWPRKHELNVERLGSILNYLSSESPRWLDLACGQGWHFAAFPGRARKVGIDISAAQLSQARLKVSDATFLRADISRVFFPQASFDLVTNFWAGYCYLDDRQRIAALVHSAAKWIAPGGALYIEVLLGNDLAAFNHSRFSQRTGFSVTPRTADFSAWQYEDVGGLHMMVSPPLEDFLEILSPLFDSVESWHDGAFMIHLVARGRH